jgi:hypothetical protein
MGTNLFPGVTRGEAFACKILRERCPLISYDRHLVPSSPCLRPRIQEPQQSMTWTRPLCQLVEPDCLEQTDDKGQLHGSCATAVPTFLMIERSLMDDFSRQEMQASTPFSHSVSSGNARDTDCIPYSFLPLHFSLPETERISLPYPC